MQNGGEGDEQDFLDSLGGGASGDYLPLSGGQMQGDIDMATKTLFVHEIKKTNWGGVESSKLTMGTQYIAYSSPYGNAMEYVADYSANYTARSLVDKSYVDNAISNTSKFLSVNGGNMQGDIEMQSHSINNIRSLISSTGNNIYLEEGLIDFANMPIAYRAPVNITKPNDIVNKQYVDSRVATSVRIVRKVLAGFPPRNSVITINHNLNTSYINVEIWVDFQDGGNITQQGAKKMVVDNTKLNIVKTGLNELKIDVLANYSTDQTLGTVEILIYSYPHATVTLLP